MEIQISNITKKYNGQNVIDIPSFFIKNGDILGVVGNNGAGKTTLFRLILDLIKLDSGYIKSGNVIVNELEDWKDYTSSYIDEGFLIDFMTPIEFFHFIGELYNITNKEIDKRLEYFHSFFNDEILNKGKKYIRDFSKGNMQKIGIVSTLLTEAKIIILDEPYNGLDPSSQIILNRIIKNYNKNSGCTFLISSHDLNHVVDTCTRISILEKGLIVRDIKNDENALIELKAYFYKGLINNAIS